MKESIGLTFTINIMIVFILVAFVFVAGIMSYNKAFKASSLMVKSLEKYEGYNKLSKEQIDSDLKLLGYSRGNSNKCAATKNSTNGAGSLVTLDNDENFDYCIYLFDNDGDANHYSYGVVVYMTVDFTMFNVKLRLPVYAKTTRIYRFS